MGMHVKKVKGKEYLYYTEMKDGKKVEKYCGSANNPMSKLKALAHEKVRRQERLQKDKEELKAIMQQLAPVIAK